MVLSQTPVGKSGKIRIKKGETISVLGSLFKRALALESPWEVREVEFIETEKRLNVWIDFGSGSEFACPRMSEVSQSI